MVPDVFWISGFVVFSIRDNHLLPCFFEIIRRAKNGEDKLSFFLCLFLCNLVGFFFCSLIVTGGK